MPQPDNTTYHGIQKDSLQAVFSNDMGEKYTLDLFQVNQRLQKIEKELEKATDSQKIYFLEREAHILKRAQQGIREEKNKNVQV